MMRRPVGDLPPRLDIPTLTGPFDVTVRPPGSKSLTNRALLLAGLAAGESCLRRPLLDADDAERMVAALTDLGVRFDIESDALLVEGVAGRWDHPAPGGRLTLNLNNAGTATRFLTAAAILADPEADGVVIDGNARMRRRPIGELVALLRLLGVDARCLGEEGFVPVLIRPVRCLDTLARQLPVPATLSSQFVSALMLVAPFLPNGLTLQFAQGPTSVAYVEMTLGLLRAVGVKAAGEFPPGGAGAWVRVLPAEFDMQTPGGPDAAGAAPCLLEPFDYEIEPDASGATYFWAAAAMTAGASCRVPGLDASSLQGDARFVRILERMGAEVDEHADGETATMVRGTGALHGVEADMSRMPDAAMTLAALCCLADGPSRLTGLRTLRVKETDRLAALKTELTKTGARIEITRDESGDEGLHITPPAGGIDRSPDAAPLVFETYDDHRMAMSLALIGLVRPNVSINDPACVAKTYPNFWRDFAGLYD